MLFEKMNSSKAPHIVTGSQEVKCGLKYVMYTPPEIVGEL
jgi:hypothetical protein